MDARSSHGEREGTFRLPLTPAMRRFLAAEVARTRTMVRVALGVAAVALPPLVATGHAAIGALALLGIGGYGLYRGWIGRRDAREIAAVGTFGRYVGPLAVVAIPIYGAGEDGGGPLVGYRHELRVPDYTFPLDEAAGRLLLAVPRGEVDYLDGSGIGAPRGVLLEVRDGRGRRAHRHPAYEPDIAA